MLTRNLTLDSNRLNKTKSKLENLLNYIAHMYLKTIIIYQLLESIILSLLNQNKELFSLNFAKIAQKIDNYICNSAKHASFDLSCSNNFTDFVMNNKSDENNHHERINIQLSIEKI